MQLRFSETVVIYILFNVAAIEVITIEDVYYGIYLIILHLYLIFNQIASNVYRHIDYASLGPLVDLRPTLYASRKLYVLVKHTFVLRVDIRLRL